GDAEVSELHASACIKQNVTWLEVTMNDAAIVCVLEGLRNLHENRNDRKIARATQAAQVATRCKLHRQEERPVLALRLVYLENEGVIEAAGAIVFVAQRVPRGRGTAAGRAQYFQRDI